jgi:hypothetical protein
MDGSELLVLALSNAGVARLSSLLQLSPEDVGSSEPLRVPGSAVSAFAQTATGDPSLVLHSETVRAGDWPASFTHSFTAGGSRSANVTWALWWDNATPLTLEQLQASVSPGAATPPLTNVTLAKSSVILSAALLSLTDATTTASNATVAFSGAGGVELWATDSLRMELGHSSGFYSPQGGGASLTRVNVTAADAASAPFLVQAVAAPGGTAGFDLGDAVPPVSGGVGVGLGCHGVIDPEGGGWLTMWSWLLVCGRAWCGWW